ncbi:MAG: hypothetical protein JRI36_12920, partial [Deltaproteobacteria bacterium]|nr:hypothetical protein [Deltaproteobacteria bacterium]
ISRIRCPTLIVQGLEDEFAEPIHAERIAERIQGSQLWLVKGARHWIHRARHADLFMARALAFFADARAPHAPDNMVVDLETEDRMQRKGVS